MNKSTPAVYGSSPPGEPPQQAGQPLVIEPINNITSIHSIHPEILACIFEFFVYDPDQAGWTLCSVCRLWWRIALSTPTLWNKIAINPENALNYNPYAYRWDVPGLDQPQYSSNGYQLCFTMGHLQAALRLTGSVGLYINFNYIFLKEEDIRRGLDMLNLVLGSPYAHKLVQLDLTFCGRTPSFTVDSYHEEAWAWSFPKLRFLRLCVDPSPFHNALLQRFSMAPGIEDIDIINTAFFGSLGLSPSLLSKWTCLRRLKGDQLYLAVHHAPQFSRRGATQVA
ncbi:hypothetical protein FRC17_009707 [Serendipita sp. 399]|nr:hypothetical protein FRC17_009707 [Serendipita sp. 399]